MKKYRGPLLQVSPVSWTGGSVGGPTINTIRIGSRTLRNVKVDDTVPPHLHVDATRDVCLYVLRMPGGVLPFWLTPNLLGMKYLDTREKHLVPFSFVLTSSIRYAVIPALVWSIACGFGGMLLGTLLGYAGIESHNMLAAPAAVGFFGGIAIAWWCAARLPLEYLRARIG